MVDVTSFVGGIGTGLVACTPVVLYMLHKCRELGKAAATDSLTGLANKRSLDDALMREIASQKRGAFRSDGMPQDIPHRCGSIGIVAIDLDGFKPINDMHGHAAGDDALHIVTQAIRKSIRGSDVAARTGGDEFVVMLRPNDTGILTIRDVVGVAQKIAENLEELKLSYMVGGDRILRNLRISVGAVVFLIDYASTWTVRDVLDIADRVMYEAKDAKGNRKHNIRTATMSQRGEVLREINTATSEEI